MVEGSTRAIKRSKKEHVACGGATCSAREGAAVGQRPNNRQGELAAVSVSVCTRSVPQTGTDATDVSGLSNDCARLDHHGHSGAESGDSARVCEAPLVHLWKSTPHSLRIAFRRANGGGGTAWKPGRHHRPTSNHRPSSAHRDAHLPRSDTSPTGRRTPTRARSVPRLRAPAGIAHAERPGIVRAYRLPPSVPRTSNCAARSSGCPAARPARGRRLCRSDWWDRLEGCLWSKPR